MEQDVTVMDYRAKQFPSLRKSLYRAEINEKHPPQRYEKHNNLKKQGTLGNVQWPRIAMNASVKHKDFSK